MAKAKLTDAVRQFLIACYATGMTPTQAANAANERFGLTMTKQQAYHYDPNGVDGRRMANKWLKLYAELRERFLQKVEEIPIASKAYRLQQLQIHYQDMLERGATRLAVEILERAAKEAGGVHSNEQVVNHNHKGKIAIEEVSEDEMRNRLVAAIATMIEGAPAQGQPTTH